MQLFNFFLHQREDSIKRAIKYQGPRQMKLTTLLMDGLMGNAKIIIKKNN